jgi:hypothetical protein
MIKNSDDLFIPIGSESMRDRDIIAKILPMKYDDYYLHQDYDLGIFGDVIFLTQDHKSIDRPILRKELKRIYDLIQKINVTYANKTYFYKDLCAKRNNRCVVDGEIYFHDSFWQRLRDKQLDRYLLNGFYTDDDAEQHLLTFIFGKNLELRVKEGTLSTKVLKLHFNLRRTKFIDGQEKNVEIISHMWEQAFLQFFEHFQSLMVRTIYSVSTSIDQELENNIYLGKKQINSIEIIDFIFIYRCEFSSCNIYCYGYCCYDLFIPT